jgi:hypothetical protein
MYSGDVVLDRLAFASVFGKHVLTRPENERDEPHESQLYRGTRVCFLVYVSEEHVTITGRINKLYVAFLRNDIFYASIHASVVRI